MIVNVTRWQRPFYSLVSVALSVSISSFALTLIDFHARHRVMPAELLVFAVYSFLCSLPGWIVSIPLVLVASDLRRWRFWALLATGTGLGPLLMLVFALCTWSTSPTFSGWAPEAKNLVFYATVISFLSTLIYLLSMRLFQAQALEGNEGRNIHDEYSRR
jgi:hypothetical protein